MKRLVPFGLLFIIWNCSDDDPNELIIDPPVEDSLFCEQSLCWDAQFYVCRDEYYIDLFTRESGWTGGDATYSVALDGNRRVWLFGDTFIDQVAPDRSRPTFRLINNSIVLQEGETMTTFHGGSASNPQAFAQPPEAGHWYWPGDGTYVNGLLYQFMHGFANDTGGAWDFYRTSVDLLTIDPTTMTTLSSERIVDDAQISWGASIFEEDDYTYIYGVLADGFYKYLYVSRTNEDLTDPWQYYDGIDWVEERVAAESIMEGVSEQFSVFKKDGTYYLLTQHNLFGSEIYLYTASGPQGPFENQRTIYCTPETDEDIFTYNAFAHLEVYEDTLLVSYNINSFDFNDLYESADNYRPYFIKISNWQQP